MYWPISLDRTSTASVTESHVLSERDLLAPLLSLSFSLSVFIRSSFLPRSSSQSSTFSDQLLYLNPISHAWLEYEYGYGGRTK
jgi:hypothetical protein